MKKSCLKVVGPMIGVTKKTDNDKKKLGCVIWITGLSAAGKTSLALAVQKKLPYSILLDGDEMRNALDFVNEGFDKGSRKALGFTYARLANLLAKQGFYVIVATISLYHELHIWNRDNMPNYVEVFLDIPENVRRCRDKKNIYKRENNVKNTCYKIDVEFPNKPHILFKNTENIHMCVDTIINFVINHYNQIIQ